MLKILGAENANRGLTMRKTNSEEPALLKKVSFFQRSPNVEEEKSFTGSSDDDHDYGR